MKLHELQDVGDKYLPDVCARMNQEAMAKVTYPNRDWRGRHPQQEQEATHVIVVEDEEAGTISYKRLFMDGHLGSVREDC